MVRARDTFVVRPSLPVICLAAATCLVVGAMAPVLAGINGPLYLLAASSVPDQFLTRSTRSILNDAINLTQRRDYEAAATLYQQVQENLSDLNEAAQRDFFHWQQRNATELQARQETINQLHLAEKAVLEHRDNEANDRLSRILVNRQYLSSADQKRADALIQRLRDTAPGMSSDTLALARAKLQQARTLICQGNFDKAESLALEVERMGVAYPPRSDTPRKVLDDIARARSDPKALVCAARRALERGELEEAAKLATLAERASSRFSLHLFGDSPAKVRRDIQAAQAVRAKQPTLVTPRPPEGSLAPPHPGSARVIDLATPKEKQPGTMMDSLKNWFSAKTPEQPPLQPGPEAPQTPAYRAAETQPIPGHPGTGLPNTPTSPDANAEAAKKLLLEARQAIQAGDHDRARRLIERAEAMKPEFNWWEELTPGRLQDELRRATTANEPANPPQKPGRPSPDKESLRAMLKAARKSYCEGKLEEARALALSVKEHKVRWGLFDDSPDKLLQDINKARTRQEQEEAAKLLAKGRELLKNGDLDGAAQLAATAQQLHGPYAIWDIGDQPRKLLADVEAARARRAKMGIAQVPPEKRLDKDKPSLKIDDRKPPPPSLANNENAGDKPLTERQVPGTLVTDSTKQKALRLLAEAKQLQEQGKLAEARKKALEADNLRAAFGPDEIDPARVLAELATLCQQQIDSLKQSAVDLRISGVNDRQRLLQAEENLARARKLAEDFGFDLLPIDREIEATRLFANASPAGRNRLPDGVPPTQRPGIDPKQSFDHLLGSGPRPGEAPPLSPEAQGRVLLDQARQELQRGQLEHARRLAADAYSEKYGIRQEAEAVLREIDIEQFKQQKLAANQAFQAGWEAYKAGNLQEARNRFRSINYRMLDPEYQTRLRELAQQPELRLADVGPADGQLGTRPPASSLPPGAARTQVADRGQPADSLPRNQRPTQVPRKQEMGMLEQYKSRSKVTFEKLHEDGLEVQRRALELFRASKADEAINLLRDHLNVLNDVNLDSESMAALRTPVEMRVQELSFLKVQNERAKQSQPKPADSSKRDLVLASLNNKKLDEENRKKQMGELINKFNAAYKLGKYEEAMMHARRALALDPDSPEATAAFEMALQKDRITRNLKDNTSKDKDFWEMAHSAKNSGPVPSDKDGILFPKEGKPRFRDDTVHTLRTPTDKERFLEYKLSMPTTVNFVDMPLDRVVDDLAAQHGLNIVLDKAALEKAGIHPTRPLTLKVEGISLKSVLNLLMRQVNLTYVIKDEVLQITTEGGAKNNYILKRYDVMEIVTPIQDFPLTPGEDIRKILERVGQPNITSGPMAPVPPGTPPFGPGMPGGTLGMPGGLPSDAAAPAGKPGSNQSLEGLLIRLITTTIAPHTWSDLGGQGTIEYYPGSKALFVSQTQDVHLQIADLLDSLRKLQEQQVAVEVKFISIREDFSERLGTNFSITSKGGPNGASPLNNLITSFTGKNFNAEVTRTGGTTSALDIPISPGGLGLMMAPAAAFPGAAAAASGLQMGLSFLSEIQVHLFLEAVQSTNRANVMQAPQLTIFNGHTSKVSVLDHQFFVTGFAGSQSYAGQMLIPHQMDFPTGVTLEINAVISSDRRSVRLTLHPTLSTMTSTEVQNFPVTAYVTPAFDAGGPTIPIKQYLQQPTFNTISLDTTVSVPDGGTVLLGGLKRLTEVRSESGPPILTKIPYINRLFTNTAYGREVDNLIIMVTPRIISSRPPEDRPQGITP